ncbi:MAG: MFS transporter [Actinobacteria bacterium]|nr:MFS transporter [Actinomycetota bacterium]
MVAIPRDNDSREGKKLSRTVKVLGFVSLFTDASSEMIYPLLPIFLSSVIGAGPAFIGLIEGLAEGTASVLKAFSGYISDKLHKRKALIFAGYGLSAVAKPFFAATTAAWQVLLIRFIERVGKGIRSAPRDAMIADTTSSDSYGRAYGFHRGMDTLGAVIGPGIAFLLMWLLRDYGDSAYRWVFFLSIVPGFIAVALIVFILRETKFHSQAHFPGIKLSGFNGGFKTMLLIVVLFTLGNSSDAFILLKAQDVFKSAGISAAMIPVLIPLLWMTFNIVHSALAMPCGILSDDIGRKKTLLLGFALYGLVYLGFAFVNNIVILWLLMAAYGIFYGLTHGVMSAYVADLAPENMKGTAFGLYHTADGVSKLIASILFGLLWQLISPAFAFLFGSLIAALAAFLLWLFGE